MNKRLCVFAHYDKDCVIEDYVIYYIKKLKDISDEIIFVSDCNIDISELTKLSDLTCHIIAQKHGEYDFGSYKRGFIYAEENGLLADTDELIFANDSCFAPIYPFEEMFEKMQDNKCDFWGLTLGYCRPLGENKKCEKIKHVQSYFTIFKHNVFTSDAFNKFIKSITSEKDKYSVVNNYEMKMTELLENAGFKYDTFLKELPDKNYYAGFNKKIRENKIPLIKKGIFKGLPQSLIETFTKNMERDLKSDYNFEYINKYYLRHNTVKFSAILKLIKKYFFRYHNKNLFFVNKWYKF